MGRVANDHLPLLSAIHHPADLRRHPASSLSQISSELRDQLIDSVSHSGGHFAASLGVVELTVALHYVFNTPTDRLIWDVGHQAYPHKMLTGRMPRMGTIRKLDGLSGFPTRMESHYDAFGVAHAGTSISAGLGMALAAADRGTRQSVIAVIGDGALNSGMAYEALNHAGSTNADLIVVLNANNMSISPNVGALAENSDGDPTGARRFFESLCFDYYGPHDGHDVDTMVNTLSTLKAGRGPRVLHVITQKGKGYVPAEREPIKYHAVAPFDPDHGVKAKSSPTPPTYTKVFGEWLCDSATADDRVVAITPAMREGSGLVEFERNFAARYFDAGIAEQHAVTLAAGFACEGHKPVVAIYSTFLQRAYDQLIHDVALQDLDVLFAIDRGGLVGADGATHHGSFDLSFMRCIPNMVIMAPANEDECRKMLQTGLQHSGPAAVRYPRGTGPGVSTEDNLATLPIGKANVRRRGKKVALLSFGALLDAAITAGDSVDATVVDMRYIKPLDTAVLQQLAASHELLVTIEDNVIAGGAGSAVNERLSALRLAVPTLNLGLPDHFVSHGTQQELLASVGLDADGIISAVDGYYQNIVPLSVRSRA